MSLKKKRVHIIKQSDGVKWSFSYSENKGIVYRVLKKNIWSDYQLVTDNSTENFSVVLLLDDRIYVLYENMKGHINLSMYDGKEWSEQQILKNEQREIFNIYFKAIAHENQIHIIYNIQNKRTWVGTLFHQKLDEKNDLSSLEVIDTIKFNYEIPFTIYTSKSKEIVVMYQKLINNHQLGYKVFSKENKVWSNFYIIDTSISPYKDYSMIITKDKIHALYVKKLENKNRLIYAQGTQSNFKYSMVIESSNIESCLFFIAYRQIWCSWVENNGIYSSFSINEGNDFSNPPYSELLTSIDVTKCTYISNSDENINNLIFYELYLLSEEPLKYLIISDIYVNPNKDDSNNNSSYMTYFTNKILEKVSMYEKIINKKDKFVIQFKYIIEEQKIKYLSYKKKLEDINEEYTKFKEAKQLLNENIKYLQESLINKEKKINELENMNIEKENEIRLLKVRTSEQENKNSLLTEELKKLNMQVEDLRINYNDSKNNSSLFKRIFNNE